MKRAAANGIAELDLRCVETIRGEGAVHLRYGIR
jgi:hypothetical protein